MNLQLATARLGVLLTAEALEAGRHLLVHLFPRKLQAKSGEACPCINSSPSHALLSPSLQFCWS